LFVVDYVAYLTMLTVSYFLYDGTKRFSDIEL